MRYRDYPPNRSWDYFAAACRKYGIDPDDRTAWLQLDEARARAKPCRECGKEGPRYCWHVCDECAAALEAERREKRRRMIEAMGPPERVGDYQPDGLGCVEKVGPVERAYLNGEKMV